MDLIASKLGANMATKSLEEGGQIGYGEGQTITYSGGGEKTDLNGLFGEAVTYAKISDNPLDLTTVNKIEYLFVFGGIEEKRSVTKDSLEYMNEGGVLEMLSAAVGGTGSYALAVSIPADFEVEGVSFFKGLYIMDSLSTGDDGNGLTSTGGVCVTLIETGEVKPIDPKYLPVVKLSATATAEGTPLSAEESAKLDEVAATGVPVAVSLVFDMGGDMTPVTAMFANMGGMMLVVTIATGMTIQIAKDMDSGVWMLGLSE